MTIAKLEAVLRAGAATALLVGAGTATAQRPTTMESCKICHEAAPGVLRGKLVSVAAEFRSLNVTVGPLVWIVKYGDDLEVQEGDRIVGPEALKAIPRDREISVRFTGPESKPVAVRVAVKQPYKVPEDKIASVDEVKALVAQGPQAKWRLVDSRPAPVFGEGHIPGAVSLPFAAFKEKAAAVLPADKGTPLVFYCGGET